MISVICPTFNSSKYIKETFLSLICQDETFMKYEIIFIDDGSSDNTISKLQSLISSHDDHRVTIKLIKSHHKGPGHARNLGIQESAYDFIAFIDSDDIWYPSKLSNIKHCISNYPDRNLFIHDEIYMRLNGAKTRITHGLHSNPLCESLYKRNFLSTSAVVVQKELLLEFNCFDEGLMSSQDYDLWLKIAKKMKLYKIDKILGEYREKSNSITSKYYLFRFYDQVKIAHRYRNYASLLDYIFKILKISFSKQWIVGLGSLLTRNKKHNY